MSPATAILLFSRSANAEAGEKCFGRRRDNLRAGELLIRHTLATLRRSGLPVFHLDESQQRGRSFGDRLAHAMAAIYARGYDKLIVVGNDCPGLRVGHLHRAARTLEEGKVVLGPDRRGGIWLLGMPAARFHAACIRSLRWQSPRTFADLAEAVGEYTELPRLADLNGRRDLVRNLMMLRAILPALAGLITLLPDARKDCQLGATGVVQQPVAGRAPPVTAD